jgi:hypothetical protein
MIPPSLIVELPLHKVNDKQEQQIKQNKQQTKKRER